LRKIVMCEKCGHAPLMHEEDGTGATCIVCKVERQIYGSRIICTERFIFPISRSEREQAGRANPDSYPGTIVCAECGCIWWQHIGYLCPDGISTFLPLIEGNPTIIH
jgi:hypothetical protein